MNYTERPQQFLHYQQEMLTPTKKEYDDGYLPPFNDFSEDVVKKFSNPNKPWFLAHIVRELIINCYMHGNHFNPNKKVFINTEETNDALIVTVGDEGFGYPKEIINELVIPFYQKRSIKKQDGRGSGFYGIRKGLADGLLDGAIITGNQITLTIKK